MTTKSITQTIIRLRLWPARSPLDSFRLEYEQLDSEVQQRRMLKLIAGAKWGRS